MGSARLGGSLPIEVKAGEVFAEPVGVVGDFALAARGREEFAASLGEGRGFTAGLDDKRELSLVKQIQFFPCLVPQYAGENGDGIMRSHRLRPTSLQTLNFGGEDRRGDASAGGEGAHGD